ncbi:class I SAM-dependent methyltransferase [Roseomonas sp. CAU 1739]|uniref:class I SAM-dependent methyltransferase n=1 Tax=Roseomonas sp. CAU 1739 TaxID=3140364 RepID=UPI00325B06D1
MTPRARDLAGAVAARHVGRAAQGFARGKLRRDPVLPALLAQPPLGDVLDLGCGRGLIALALVLAGRARSVTGLDLDTGKIARAAVAADGLLARFAVADLATAEIPPCDTVLLIDVLSQMPPDAQHALLARILAVAPARIIIRTPDPERGWRSAVGLAAEHLRRWFGADRAGYRAVAPLLPHDLTAPLEAAGYRIAITPCWAGTPLPNVLILAERP